MRKLLIACGLVLAVLLVRADEQAEVEVAFNARGLSAITYDGEDVYWADSPSKGRPSLIQIWVRQPDGKVTLGGANQKVLGHSVDVAAQSETQTYAWGTLSTTYKATGNRLDIWLDVTNTSDSLSIQALSIQPFELSLASDSGRNKVDNISGLVAHRILTEHHALALGNWEFDRPVMLEIDQRRYANQRDPLSVNINVYAGGGSHPVVDSRWWQRPARAIGPGESDRYRISLYFGPRDTQLGELASEMFSAWRETIPATLDWPDRRPIGRIFLANPATGWKTNPRGFRPYRDGRHNVFTDEGRAAFRADLLRYAAEGVRVLQEMNAQGVVVWDIEGQEAPHAISYIGQPQLLPTLAPEMEPVADEFFKTFTDAGLKVGVTIRPTEVYQPDPDRWAWTHRYTADPVETMDAKIQYAKKRWGATIFYLDSNVFGADFGVKQEDLNVPWIMPVSMIRELRRRNPDVLIIAEWTTPQYLGFAAAYVHVNLKSAAIDPQGRRLYPQGFGVISHTHLMIEERYETYLKGVTAGDILFCGATPGGGNNPYVKLLYADVALAGTDKAARIAQSDLDGLVALLDDKDIAVRKHALSAISRLTDAPAENALVNRLVTCATLPLSKPDSVLRLFAIRALGALGEPGLDAVKRLAASSSSDVQLIARRELRRRGEPTP